ncbi:uncharacterized protein DSM5745_10560 [Aspergillus mulundensis]|uniref:Uncharacterized protein n=1 Tax=Aspergillus mulundensis TaxID=1810919 RepID=A0A3D8QJJ7_9EURO|nr:hypothetical protein DSM5745_10560 [Aspergillus mulundensis]RDW61888.1 hypothetical protein DSM5745_10560 [Aspergillus mulundensis]
MNRRLQSTQALDRCIHNITLLRNSQFPFHIQPAVWESGLYIRQTTPCALIAQFNPDLLLVPRLTLVRVVHQQYYPRAQGMSRAQVNPRENEVDQQNKSRSDARQRLNVVVRHFSPRPGAGRRK